MSTTPANVRDLGGLPTAEGGVTRHGVLLRGDALYAGDGAPDVADWPPRLVVDLRSAAEVRRYGQPWPAVTRVVHHPLHDGATPRGISDTWTLSNVYAAILDESPHLVASAITLIASESTGAVYTHCTVGKDRTGVVVAAALLAAGVQAEAVISDYVRSETAMPALEARWLRVGVRKATSPPLHPTALTAPREAIEPVVARLNDPPGGARSWLERHGAPGDVLDAWRERFVSHAPATEVTNIDN